MPLRPDVAASPDHARDTETPSEDGLAVRLTGYLGHTLGLGAAARGYAQALAAAGVPVSTVTVPLHHLALPVKLDGGYGRHGFEDLVHEGLTALRSSRSTPTSCPASSSASARTTSRAPHRDLGLGDEQHPAALAARVRAGRRDLGLLALHGREHRRGRARARGRAAAAGAAPAEPAEPLRLGVPDGFLFLFVFDYLSTVQRKNPVGLIEAFKRAFAPGEGLSC